MAKDFLVDDKGDLYIDEQTHDLVIVDGVEEVAQRIKATLEIRFQEMMLLDSEMGMDYTDFFGKRFNKTDASMQLRETIMRFVPEVDSVEDIQFDFKSSNRHMQIDFKAMVTPTESKNSQLLEGGVSVGY